MVVAGRDSVEPGNKRRRRRCLDGVSPHEKRYNLPDLVKAGIVDPTKVTRSLLQNAASIAGLSARESFRMHATAVAKGKVVRFKLSAALARVHRTKMALLKLDWLNQSSF